MSMTQSLHLLCDDNILSIVWLKSVNFFTDLISNVQRLLADNSRKKPPLVSITTLRNCSTVTCLSKIKKRLTNCRTIILRFFLIMYFLFLEFGLLNSLGKQINHPHTNYFKIYEFFPPQNSTTFHLTI